MRPIFLHIPRTGGMSLRSVFDEVLGRENVGRPWWGTHAGEPLNHEQRSKKAWYGHFRFGLHRFIGPDARYITILREPTQRFLSEYHRNHYRERKGLTPLQLISNLSQCHGYDNVGDNLQVRMLAGLPNDAVVESKHVALALKNLRKHFDFIGYTDSYERVFDYLRHSMGWRFSPVHINSGPSDRPLLEGEYEELKECPQLRYDYMLWRALRDSHTNSAIQSNLVRASRA
jgi:hypothetical protein